MGSVANSLGETYSPSRFGNQFAGFHSQYVSQGDHTSQEIFVSYGDPGLLYVCDISNMNETYQTRLQRIRKERKIKQIEAADAAGVGRPYISDLENGNKDGSLEVILKLAKFYDVSLDYLFGRSDLPHTQSSESVAHDEKERILLQIWRSLSNEEKSGLMLLLQGKAFGPSAA